jgi:hypothetical protein
MNTKTSSFGAESIHSDLSRPLKSQAMVCAPRSLNSQALARASRTLNGQAVVRASHGLNSWSIEGAARPSVSSSIGAHRPRSRAMPYQATQVKAMHNVSLARLRPNHSFKRTCLRHAA